MKNIVFWTKASLIISVAVFVVTCVPSVRAGQAGKLIVPIDEASVVVFSLQSPNMDYPHPPLIFRIAKDSSQLETTSLTVEGRSVYVSIEEMRSMLGYLDRVHVRWHTGNERGALVPFLQLPRTGKMTITVLSDDETASTNIEPGRVCKLLAGANRQIVTARAHWQFEYFRRMYLCKVPDFRAGAYPDER